MEINTLGAAAIQATASVSAIAAPEISLFKLHFLNILSGVIGFMVCALIVCIWALIQEDVCQIIRNTIKKIFKRGNH